MASVLIIVLSILAFSFVMHHETVKEEVHRVNIGSLDSVNITVLIDNNAYNDLKNPWGISVYIETPSETILFDTGPSPSDLEYNCKLLNIDLSKVSVIVLSHEHGDHVGGLSYVAKHASKATVYIPSEMSTSIKNWIRNLGFKKIVEVKKTTVISKGIAVIGELYGPPFEQALAINVEGVGLVVVVGCSHPGVDKIAHKIVVESKEKPYLVLGGFHMASASGGEINRVISNLIADNIKYIAPMHCSGSNFRSIMDKDYHDKYLELHVGSKLIINSTGVHVRG